MALPKINTAPKYEAVVPSTKQTVRFRPYLVKEEKVLMMAMETQDTKQAMAAVVDTIESCVTEPLDKNKLTTFDVEYLFTRIRAKSVGETAKTGLKCESCEHPNEVIIPIEEIIPHPCLVTILENLLNYPLGMNFYINSFRISRNVLFLQCFLCILTESLYEI